MWFSGSSKSRFFQAAWKVFCQTENAFRSFGVSIFFVFWLNYSLTSQKDYSYFVIGDLGEGSPPPPPNTVEEDSLWNFGINDFKCHFPWNYQTMLLLWLWNLTYIMDKWLMKMYQCLSFLRSNISV